MQLSTAPANILVIKLRAIGDVLLSSVVLPNLRAAYPDAVIDMLTERMSRDVLEGNPALSSVLVFDPKKEGGLGLITRIRRRRYDLVIDLFGNPRSAIITLFSGAPRRVGYRFGWRARCYTTVVEPRGGEVHNTEFNLDALRAIGLPVVSRSVAFPVGQAAERFAEAFFREHHLEGQFVVALNPCGGWSSKRWGIDQFAALGDLLSERLSAKVVILWGPGEKPDADRLAAAMRAATTMLPPTSLKELAAILGRCSLVATNDSGPMHIAASMRTPVVAIFGPTNPKLQGPYDTLHAVVRNEHLDCLGCNLTTCPIGNPCMTDLTPESVFAACERLAREHHPPVNHSTTP
jgi:lipopolysaccharide heptosyltransferase II